MTDVTQKVAVRIRVHTEEGGQFGQLRQLPAPFPLVRQVHIRAELDPLLSGRAKCRKVRGGGRGGGSGDGRWGGGDKTEKALAFSVSRNRLNATFSKCNKCKCNKCLKTFC